jgi:hypothetical protein
MARERPRTAVGEPSGHLAAVLAADDDERPAPGERTPQTRDGRVATDVEDQAVAVGAVGEVFAGVVDDVVGAE